MKKNKFKLLKLCAFIISMLDANINAQVGINTTTPAPSSALDISSSNKGVLIPQYDLINLNSTSAPVSNPTNGLIIYNKGGASTHPKGLYFWSRGRWQRVLNAGAEPQIMFISKTGGTNSILVPTNTYDHALTDLSLFTNRITGASLGTDLSSFTLPAGTYILQYGVDAARQGTLGGGAGTGPANTTYFGNIFTCVRTYLINAATNLAITDTDRYCQLSNDFKAYKGVFYLTLSAPTTIKQKFEFDAGNGFSADNLIVRSNFGLVITKVN